MSKDTGTAAAATETGQSSTSETEGTDTTTKTTPAASTEGQGSTTADPSGTAEGAGGEGGTASDAPWQDGLPEGLNTDPVFRGYRDVGELAKAHANLLKLKGVPNAEILRVPTKPRDQDPDAWAAFDKARGVPEDATKYEIALAPEAAADTPELAGILRELGGKAKFDPHQMAAVVETLNDLGKKAAEREAADLAAETERVNAELDKEWGAAAEGNRRAIGKLIRDALGGEIGEEAAADLETKLGSNATLSKVLAHAVSQMAEPTAPEGGDGGRATPARQMTPTQASAALNAFYADPEKVKALNDKRHPQHAAVMAERAALLAAQRGEKRPDQPKG